MKRIIQALPLALMAMILMVGCNKSFNEGELSPETSSAARSAFANPDAGTDYSNPILVGTHSETFYFTSEIDTYDPPFSATDYRDGRTIFYKFKITRPMEVIIHTYNTAVAGTTLYLDRWLDDDLSELDWYEPSRQGSSHLICDDSWYLDAWHSAFHKIELEAGTYTFSVEGRKIMNAGVVNGRFKTTVLGRPVQSIPGECIPAGLDPNAARDLWTINRNNPSATATVNSRNLWNIYPGEPEYDAHFRFQVAFGTPANINISARTPDYSKVTMTLFRGLSYDDMIAWEKVEQADHNAMVSIQAQLPDGEYMILVESGSEAYLTDIIVNVDAEIPPVRNGNGTSLDSPKWAGDFDDKFYFTSMLDNSRTPFVTPSGQLSAPVYVGFTVSREMEIFLTTLQSAVYATSLKLYKVNIVNGRRTYALQQSTSNGSVYCENNTNTILQKAWLTRILQQGEYVIETSVRSLTGGGYGYKGEIHNQVLGRIPTGANRLLCMPDGLSPIRPLSNNYPGGPYPTDGFWDTFGARETDVHFVEYLTRGIYQISATSEDYPHVGIYVFDDYNYDSLINATVTPAPHGELTFEVRSEGVKMIIIESGTDDFPTEVSYTIRKIS